jgi:hypothetical protein
MCLENPVVCLLFFMSCMCSLYLQCSACLSNVFLATGVTLQLIDSTFKVFIFWRFLTISTFCINLAALLGVASIGLLIIYSCLTMDSFSQPLIITGVFQVAKEGDPCTANFEFKLSVNAHMWPANSRISKSSCVCY